MQFTIGLSNKSLRIDKVFQSGKNEQNKTQTSQNVFYFSSSWKSLLSWNGTIRTFETKAS